MSIFFYINVKTDAAVLSFQTLVNDLMVVDDECKRKAY